MHIVLEQHEQERFMTLTLTTEMAQLLSVVSKFKYGHLMDLYHIHNDKVFNENWELMTELDNFDIEKLREAQRWIFPNPVAAINDTSLVSHHMYKKAKRNTRHLLGRKNSNNLGVINHSMEHTWTMIVERDRLKSLIQTIRITRTCITLMFELFELKITAFMNMYDRIVTDTTKQIASSQLMKYREVTDSPLMMYQQDDLTRKLNKILNEIIIPPTVTFRYKAITSAKNYMEATNTILPLLEKALADSRI